MAVQAEKDTLYNYRNSFGTVRRGWIRGRENGTADRKSCHCDRNFSHCDRKNGTADCQKQAAVCPVVSGRRNSLHCVCRFYRKKRNFADRTPKSKNNLSVT